MVTGIGLVTGLGADREATWAALRAGASAARVLEGLDATGMPHAGCPVPALLPKSGVGPDGESEPDDPALAWLQLATEEALADSGLRSGAIDPDRLGCLIGLSKGGVRSLAAVYRGLNATGPGSGPGAPAGPDIGALGRLWLDAAWPHVGSTRVARRLGARGPCLAPVAACATGLVAVLQGAELIRRGACDAALAGASDASLEPFLLSAFRRMRALARVGSGDDPARAVRPLDRGRSGFLVGEGAAVLVLERADHAAARGARGYAEVAGGALGADAHHLTDLDPDPANLAGLIARALVKSATDPATLDHINLHGTATRPNDPLECRALRAALGPRVDEIACSANKPQIGHLLGAAGAAELAITCLAIRDGFIPPTLNLTDPDPACDLDATPQVGRPRPIRAALKLSLGFGGHLAAAVLRKP